MYLQSQMSTEEFFRAIKENLSPGYTLIRKTNNRFVLSSDEKSFYLNFRILIRVPRIIVGTVHQEKEGCTITAKMKIKTLNIVLYILSLAVFAAIIKSFHPIPAMIGAFLIVIYPLIIAYFSRGDTELLVEQIKRVITVQSSTTPS